MAHAGGAAGPAAQAVGMAHAGGAAGPAARDGWRGELCDPGAIVAATEGDFPPFSLARPVASSVVGIEAAVCSEVCARLGVAYRPLLLPWRDILAGLGGLGDDCAGAVDGGGPGDTVGEGGAAAPLAAAAVAARDTAFDMSTASMDITPQRRARFLFTMPYYRGCAVVCLPRRYRTLADAHVRRLINNV